MRLPLTQPSLGTWPANQAHALTGDRTGDPLVCRPALDPLNHTSQGRKLLFGNKYRFTGSCKNCTGISHVALPSFLQFQRVTRMNFQNQKIDFGTIHIPYLDFTGFTCTHLCVCVCVRVCVYVILIIGVDSRNHHHN